VDHRLEAARDLFIEPATPDGAKVNWYTYHTSQMLSRVTADGQGRCHANGVGRARINDGAWRDVGATDGIEGPKDRG
jgi:hypothetical protein